MTILGNRRSVVRLLKRKRATITDSGQGSEEGHKSYERLGNSNGIKLQGRTSRAETKGTLVTQKGVSTKRNKEKEKKRRKKKKKKRTKQSRHGETR